MALARLVRVALIQCSIKILKARRESKRVGIPHEKCGDFFAFTSSRILSSFRNILCGVGAFHQDVVNKI